jgi:hypothetical protein
MEAHAGMQFVGMGHRVVLLRRLGRSSEDHAVTASQHEATLNNGATPYTTSFNFSYRQVPK